MTALFWTAERRLAAQEHICQRIGEGESLRTICKHANLTAEPPTPNAQTANTWLHEDAGFRDKYTLARQQQADLYADQILEIARSAYGQTREDVQAARLEIDCLKWLACKLHPRAWSDRQQVDLTASINVNQATDEELRTELARLMPVINAAIGTAIM